MGKKSMAAIAESMKALRELLQFIVAMAEALLRILLAPFRALGLIGGGGRTAAGIADAALAQVEAEDAYDEPVTPAYAEEPTLEPLAFNVASSVWVRTLELRGLVAPGKAQPLPPEVEAWVVSLSPAEIGVVSGLGLAGIASHLAAGPAGSDNRLPPYRGGTAVKIDPVEAGLILARAPRRQVMTERAIAYDVETDGRTFAM